MEWLRTTYAHLADAPVVEAFAQIPLTDIVIAFLCSKPVFTLAALLIGVRAYLAQEDDLPKRLPYEH